MSVNTKYLERSAEPEAARSAELLLGRKFGQFLAIPACGEHKLLPESFLAVEKACKNRPTLLVLVINENRSSQHLYSDSNQKTLAWLAELLSISSDSHMQVADRNSLCVLVINRCGERAFPEKQGVGLSRKIGNDIGAMLFSKGIVCTPWLHNTDADAKIPYNFFEQASPYTNLKKPPAALLYNFLHHNDDKEASDKHWQAAISYEIWLRYYVLGLRHARSHCAYQSVGSTICSHAVYYTRAHGFPKKAAGEDFYLLNKMHKLSPLHSLKGEPIQLTNRVSARVPFGTGQGTQKIVENSADGGQHLIYHPKCFEALKCFLIWIQKGDLTLSAIPDDFETSVRVATDGLIKHYDLGALKRQLEQAKTRARSQHQEIIEFHRWFDSFLTLKSIHFLRDNFFSNLPVKDALGQASFISCPLRESLFSNLTELRRLELS